MLKFKYKIKILLCFICIYIFSSLGVINVKANTNSVYLGGFTIGLAMQTNQVEVVGVCDILTSEGIVSPCKNAGIKSGDIIQSVNGVKISSINELNKEIEKDYKILNIDIERNNANINVNMKSVVELSTGKKKIGLLVKDSISGIGTVTYIECDSGKYGALGHAVLKDNKDIDILDGDIFNCEVYDIKRSIKGKPGELKGVINNTEKIGDIKYSNQCGVFGTITDKSFKSKLQIFKKGKIQDVQPGKAQIYTNVAGNKIEEYQIEIVKVDKDNKENRNYVIKIIDEKLIAVTGGIVQGMSGSPIVQNGNLIGAVTHVFINDPLRGFGISLENMQNSY